RRTARRAARDHGLPRRGARQPAPDAAGDECPAARDGGDRAFRPVQPWPSDLGTLLARRDRPLVPERTMTMKRSPAMAAVLALVLVACQRGGDATDAEAAAARTAVEQAEARSEER